MTRGAVIVLLLAVARIAHADQYRSEVRELPGEVSQEKPQVDEQKLLQQTTDPYAKALILRDLATQAADKKDYNAAAKYLQQAIATSGLAGPAQDEMKKVLSQLYMASGDPDKIIEGLSGRARTNQLSPDEMAALGGAFVKKKDYSQAIPLLKRAQATHQGPGNAAAMLSLIAAYIATGQQKEALPVAEQLVRVAPNVREAWLNLAALQMKAGNRERAQAVMELAQRQGYLKEEKERLQLINLTAQIGAPFEAGSLLKAWLDSGEVARNADNWKFLAATWNAARERGLAITALKESYRLAPNSEMLTQIGQLELDREHFADAEQALTKAAAAGAKSGPVMMQLGLAQYQQGNVQGALKSFKEAQTFAATKGSAEGWLKFLDSPSAAEVAQTFASKHKPPKEMEAKLSTRLTGKPIVVTDANFSGASTPSSGPLQLTGEFTPVGAERGGTPEGSIPQWTGGLTRDQWPATFKPGARLVDPFANEKPIFIITAQNYKQYAAKLSRAHQALFAKYPDYRMPVYPTHRTATYPQAIYDASLANIGKAKLSGSDALEGARLGFPFPRPQNGVEIMWNHRVRYRGDTLQSTTGQAVVMPDGEIRDASKAFFRIMARYANVANPANIAQENMLLKGITFTSKNGRSADYVVLFHETANSIKDPRRLWVLIVGAHKLLRIPPVGYDFPMPGTEAIALVDMIDMYNGPFDRYVWKLVGKRELYLPYNAYRISDGHYKYPQLLTGKFLNPDATRYELHRVWIIEATERGGKKHLFGKRTFYVDEDTWNATLVENEDHDGNLWRFQEGHVLPDYEHQDTFSTPVITYDLKDGRYLAWGLLSEEKTAEYNTKMIDAEFNPDAMKNRYDH